MKRAWMIAGILLFAGAVSFLLPSGCPEAARRVAFIFIAAACFWALEIIPLYATSLAVVLLHIFLLGKPGGILGLDETGYTMFFVPFSSPVIMLFFGGFMLAAGIQKHRVDRLITGRLLGIFGQRPFFILAGFMATTAFFSMWLSNTATTAMVLAMIMPLLHKMDNDDAFKKALALSIAFSANIGGMATPIGTPPNAIALGLLTQQGIFLNFLDWMKMALPLVVVLLFAAAGILFIFFRPKYARMELGIELGESLDWKGKAASAIAIGTALLWLTSGWHRIPEAVIALLAAGIYMAAGLLDRNDLKKIDWDILVLMWGGLALGKGIEVSGLAGWILNGQGVSSSGTLLVVIFCLGAALLSMFISNTAAANLMIPLAISIPGENQVVLAIIIALSCSLGMALPISTPPNAMAFSTQVLSARDMLKAGMAVCIISILIILAGFRFML